MRYRKKPTWAPSKIYVLDDDEHTEQICIAEFDHYVVGQESKQARYRCPERDRVFIVENDEEISEVFDLETRNHAGYWFRDYRSCLETGRQLAMASASEFLAAAQWFDRELRDIDEVAGGF